MRTLSLSGKSLVGRLMLAFSLLGLLLLLLISLGSVSLYWVKLADKYLYEEALPASEAARQLMQSSNALLDNAQRLERVEKEAERAFLGRKLSIESTNLLAAIERLSGLNVKGMDDTGLNKTAQSLQQLGASNNRYFALFAGEIIHDLSILGQQVGERLTLAHQLHDKGRALAEAASRSSELLEAELAVVDAAILAKLSLAYPQLAGNAHSTHLLDTIIEQDLDIRERLNRALALVHHIALIGQLLQSPEQQLGLNNVLASMSRVLTQSDLLITPQYNNSGVNNSHGAGRFADPVVNRQIDLMPLELLKDLVRDPTRATDLFKELVILKQANLSLGLQLQYSQVLTRQNAQLLLLTNKLGQLNKAVDSAMKTQQSHAVDARHEFLQQLFWAKSGLWATGILMLIIMALVVYRVIYQGIALRLNEATSALSQLSQGNIDVELDPHGDDELTAMASAIEVFKKNTAHNQALQTELQATASELFSHKASLESTVQARTLELAEANRQLDAEAKGHSAARVMAEQASQAKSLFLATMSHEIRTPLNGLLGTLTLLGHGALPPAQKQMLALSQYSGTLLQTVLNDILDFSRLEQGKLTNEPRSTALNDLLDEVMAIMNAGAGLSGLSLRLVRHDLPMWVNIDGPKLRQVLFNLLANAIKFTPTGEIVLKVSVDSQRLVFEITDTGVGISEAAMKQLFIAYSTLPNQSRTRGTGLGLAICKELVALMNDAHSVEASIWVKSIVGKGSTFGFSLPLHACNEAYAPVMVVLPKVAPQCVLVIEDNKVNAMVAQGFLAHLGHSSVLVDSCARARALYRADTAQKFDGIMLDIQLGDGSGIALLAELKQIAALAKLNVSIAAFTAQIQEDDMHVYQDSGFDQVLAKPLNMQSLARWIGVATDEASAVTGTQLNVVELAEAAQQPLLDKKQIIDDLQYLGDRTMKEMFSLFSNSSTAQITALADNNCDAATLLHALKGSSASMGCIALSQRCKQLELDELNDDSYQSLKKLWQASISALELILTH